MRIAPTSWGSSGLVRTGQTAPERCSQKRNPGGGIPGLSGAGDRISGVNRIAPGTKQHRAMSVQVAYAAATGSISDGSLFRTLPTRALTGQQLMSSEGEV